MSTPREILLVDKDKALIREKKKKNDCRFFVVFSSG